MEDNWRRLALEDMSGLELEPSENMEKHVAGVKAVDESRASANKIDLLAAGELYGCLQVYTTFESVLTYILR